MESPPVPVMVSFGNVGGLRSFQLLEVQDSDMLSDLVSQFEPENWSGENSSISVKISNTKMGGFDKFSLRNSISLVLRVLKADVLWIVFEKSVTKPLEPKNAFLLLKQAQQGKVLPKKIEKPINQKQILFNNMIDNFEEKGVTFSHPECAPRMKHKSTGSATQLLQDLTDIVWKIGHCEKQLSAQSLWTKVPVNIRNLISFQVKSKDLIQMSQHSAKMFATNIREIADKAVMAREKLASLRNALFQAAEVFLEYSRWLESHAEKVRLKTASQRMIGTAAEAVMKQVGEREKVSLIEKGTKPATHPVVVKIFEEMKTVECYQPVNISVLLPANKLSRSNIMHRTIPSQAPERFVIWSFENGSVAPKSLFVIPVDQGDTTSQILKKIGELRPELLKQQKIFFPREFYQQFYDQVGSVTGISAQALKLTSSMIIGDNRKFDGDVQDRFGEALMIGDPDYVFDLRHYNGRSIKFREFLEEFRSAVEEYMVEDRGRHEMQYDGTVVSKVSMGFSLRNVFEEVCSKVKEKLPNCPLPKSEHFLHRYLIPRTGAAAQSLTRQVPLIPLKLASQQKVIEKPNIDAHYNAAQYKYLKNMAVEHGNEVVTLVGWDDKTGVDVGERHQPTAATQHTGKSWMHQKTVAGEGQHSFHKTNLTPSVRFVHNIPADITGSFYRGQPQVALKDAIFQPSNSARHAAELSQMFHKHPELVKPALFVTNDGGSDHTIRYERNVVAMLAVFLSFPDIQLLINFQLAAYRSAYHPVEKLNCLLNLAWNGISLSREVLEDDVLEKVFASCNSMKDARKAAEKHPGLKDAVLNCLRPSVELLEERAKQASLKENFFETFQPASDKDIKEFLAVLVEVDPDFDVDDYLDKSKTYHYSPAIKTYLERHAGFTYYSISFRRNVDLSPDYLRKKFPNLFWSTSLEPLPCPILDKENPGKFLSYENIKKCERDFTDAYQPAKHQKTPSNIPFTKNKIRALYGAPVEVGCDQCGKRRVVYFKYKPTKDQLNEAIQAVEDIRYICGGRMSTFGRSLAVVEEITEGNIVDVIDEIENEQIEPSLLPNDKALKTVEALKTVIESENYDSDCSDQNLDTSCEEDEQVDLNSNLLVPRTASSELVHSSDENAPTAEISIGGGSGIFVALYAVGSW